MKIFKCDKENLISYYIYLKVNNFKNKKQTISFLIQRVYTDGKLLYLRKVLVSYL